MLNRLRPLALIGIALTLLSQLALAADPIKVGGDHNYPPYEFLNANGEPDGYNTELTLAIAEVMGIDVEIELSNWDDVRNRLESGEIDTLQGMAFSAERSEKYAFSPAHALVHQSIFARKGAPRVASLDALKGHSVIVQRGGIMHDYLLENNVGANLVLVDTHAAALRLLASGKHDYALVANLPGLYLGRELELNNIVPVGKPFGAQSYGYSVLKDNTELLAQFSEGLAILKNTGRQQAIYDKWLGPLEQKGLPWNKIGQFTLWASLLLLLGMSAIMFWNRMLTREVSRRTEELKLQQQQLIQADKMTSLGILVSGVAHEINNPSSLLLLNLPIIKEVYQDAEEILEAHYQQHGDYSLGGLPYSRMREAIPPMLDDMMTGTNRIRRIVDDLRDFARQTPSELTEQVDLNEVVATAIRLVDNTIRQSCDNFSVNYEPALPRFSGNAQRIEQVVINLIVNACQALTSPSQSIKVRTFRNADGLICLEVTDQGQGIAEENLARLGDPFFTTRREQGGTGLGLSVSQRIIQEHNGTLHYHSTVGKGTRVKLVLNPIYTGSHS